MDQLKDFIEAVKRAREQVDRCGSSIAAALVNSDPEAYHAAHKELRKWRWEMLACERELVDEVLALAEVQEA